MEMPVPDQLVLSKKMGFVASLEALLPPGSVIHDPFETKAYECDAFTAYACPPMAVALPSTTAEVQSVLKTCRNAGVPVVPRAAGTSLAGGALPTADCVVLSTARMTNVLETDYENRFIRVQAGRTNSAVTSAVEAKGFFYAPDPSSQLACTIAGNVAMNSGGAHCLKYGVTTNNLLGLTMVTMDGEILELGGPYLDSSGLDLMGVVCGSEGQLGIVTEAVLKILPKPEGARPILMGFSSSEAAGGCVSDIIGAGIIPAAIEFMDRLCIRACEDFARVGYPDVEALLIVEVDGSEDEIDQGLSIIKQIAAKHKPEALRESTSEEESRRIWAGRKGGFGAMGRLNDYICLDGTIPVSKLPFVLNRIGKLAQEFELEVANIFHAGDGNMHPLILYDSNEPGAVEKAELLGAEILKLCVESGGCLTGEHGVGAEKRDLMHFQYNQADLEAQLRVKDVFDPAWLLNPAKVFPLELTERRRA